MNDEIVIEALYQLSPMQRGMLFHTLYAALPGIYVDQIVCRLEGPLDPQRFSLAWQKIVTRHPILRTAFLWEEVDEPVQVVSRFVSLPWEQHDWRGISESEQQVRLYDWLAQDRVRSFDLATPPLLRLVLMQVSENNYILVWTFHHLLLDGWSMCLVLQEVLTVYEALCAGQTPQLQQRRPYWDYLAWLDEQDLGKAEAFWKQRLQGIATPTPIFTERPEYWAQMRGSGSAQRELDHDKQPSPSALAAQQFWQRSGQAVRLQGLRLSRAFTTNLRTFARQRQLTLNTLIQGAWALLLSRYSTTTDVLFGATVAGRSVSLPGAEDMIGLFINTLPVRIKVPEDMTLLVWLEQLQIQEAEARQYEYTPLVQVHGWSEIPRERPLFESIIVFESYPVDQMLTQGYSGNDGIKFRWEYVLEQTNYPLVVVVAPWDELEILFGYDVTCFAPETIIRMQRHLQTLLEGMLANPDAPPTAIQMLSAAERRQLVAEWNHSQGEAFNEMSVPELIRLQAAHRPDAVALVCDDEQITYAALLRRANQCAHYLQLQGVGAEVRVGVCMQNSSALAVALLGVLIAGGVYVPIGPTYPETRRNELLAHAAIAIVLSSANMRTSFAHSHASIIYLDADWSMIAQEEEISSPPPFHLEQAAYIMYTSGSTGQPKGVVVSQRALAHHAPAVIERYKLQPEDRVLQFASISFDVSLEELLPSWCSGATVVMRTQLAVPSLEELTQLVEALGLTVLNLPSSYWHEWMVELTRTRRQLAKTLRLLIVGSEPVLSKTLELWRNLGGDHIAWCNAYGLTETTITAVCTQDIRQQASQASSLPVSIGRPLSGVQAYVLDAQLRPVPLGIPGELYIGGSGLAQGYLGSPDLTAERFVPDPFVAESVGVAKAGSLLYRTGDRARYLPDGNLEYLGRIDTQIKVRGFRIEPGEIEALIRKYPGVREAVVLAQREQTQDQAGLAAIATSNQQITGITAYVVTTRRTTSLQERLQRYLEAHLPPYMLPNTLVILETLPRTPGGKVDLRALMSLNNPQKALARTFEAPETAVEEILVNIWASVLHMQSIGRQDHFFKLGGHSLQATQIIARIREALRIDLSVRALYDAPTVAALGEYIQGLRGGQRKMPPIVTIARDKPLPLSFAQQRLWFLMQMEPLSSFYTMTSALRLQGVLNVRALEQSLQALIERHETLRTTFALVDNLPVQIIAPELQLMLPLIDLIMQEPMQRARIVEQILKEGAHYPFDLTHGPLLSCHLLRLTATEHVLLLSLHHIVADGWSIGILVQELNTFYRSYVQDQKPILPPLPLHYADYTFWQRQWLEDEENATRQALQAFWHKQLAEAPAILDLPTDYPRPPFTTFSGKTQIFAMPTSLYQSLRTLSRNEGVTLFMTLLAAFQVLLMRYTGQEDLVIGTPIAGRTQRETENLIGLFLNTLVLRTDLSGNPGFSELLARVREVCLNAYEHQEFPFEKLVEELQPVRSASHTPLFQVLFALQNLPAEEGLSLPELTSQLVPIERDTAKFDLTFFAEERGEELAIIVEYNSDLFKSATISQMVKHYQQLLSTLADDPGRPIWQLPLLTESERTQLLNTWNTTRTPYPRLASIHEIFVRQAASTPDAIALVSGDQQMSYQELNKRANQLAHYLRGVGISLEVPVGICLERSFDMIIGLLAILKAGGVYTPLDPQYPEKRLALLAQDAHIAFLLTEEKWRERWQSIGEDLPLLCLDSEWCTISQEPVTDLITPVRGMDLAYIMYTSGSTGQPKGVSITHQSVLRLVKNTNYAHLTAKEIFLQFAPLAFDASTFEIWGSLLNGAKLVLFPAELPSLHELAQLLQREHVTTLWLTAGLFHQMVENQLDGLSSVRQLLAGGDALSLTHVQKVLRELVDCQLINGYGPTENTTFSATHPFPRSAIDVVPIGRAIPNTTLYVLDRFLQPVPVGVPGELYLGGDGLARDYIARPDLTAERFIPHPFSSQRGERLYRTGDRVRWLPDGNLLFLGRIDHQQVKVRGFRIELGEIETVLKAHEAVQDAIVVAREDAPGERRLVAYIIGVPGASPDRNAIRSYLQEHLPTYMIPSTLVELEQFPLNPNGKIDRQKLPLPSREHKTAEIDATRPETEVEHALTKIWREILGLKLIGIHENFFELGGDSIQVIQVCTRARLAHLSLSPRLMFQYQTIAQLAPMLTYTDSTSSLSSEPDLPAGPLPLTPIQQWFFSLSLSEPQHWNQAILLSTPSPLDLPALYSAMLHLMHRHAALRISFSPSPSGWLQNLALPDSLPSVTELLPIVDLSGLPQQEQSRLTTHLCSQVQGSLSLQHAPLGRALLLLTGPSEPPLLLLVLHHLIIDAVSWSILLRDLQTAYLQATQRLPIPLAPPPTPLPAWATLLQEAANRSAVLQEADFWLAQGREAAGISPLPRDFAASEQDNVESSAQTVEVALSPEETVALLQQVPRAYHTQINDILLTALAETIYTWTGERRLLLSLEGHGRQPWETLGKEIDLSETVGWLTILYPVLLDLRGCQGLAQSLPTIKEQLRRVPGHGRSYGLLRYLASDNALHDALSSQPEPEISFNYLGQGEQKTEETGGFRQVWREIGPAFSPQGTRAHVLDLLGGVREGRFHLAWIYSERLHTRSTIETLALRYLSVLRSIIEHCLSPDVGEYTPSDFPLARLNKKTFSKIARLLEKDK